MLPSDGDEARRRIEAAAAHAQALRRQYARLARINRAIRRWEEWEANQELPIDLRRELRTPTIDHDSLVSLRETALEAIGELEGKG